MLAVWGKERKGQEAMYVVWVGLKWVVVVLISLIFSVTQINLTRRMQFKKKTFLIYKFDFISWVRYIWKWSCSFETEGNLLQYLATIWLGSRNWMFRGLMKALASWLSWLIISPYKVVEKNSFSFIITDLCARQILNDCFPHIFTGYEKRFNVPVQVRMTRLWEKDSRLGKHLRKSQNKKII